MMRGLWLEGQRLTLRNNLTLPVPAAGEALVRVRMAGICSTDLELTRGYYPFTGTPGHEFVGDIASAPEAPARAGERVVGEINSACGLCPSCLSHRHKHCTQRRVLGIKDRNGAFAEYLCLPLSKLIPVPDSIPDCQAVFTEPLAAALQIQQQVHIQPTDRVLVIGAGRLGQLIAQTLRLTGCELNVVARHKKQQTLLAAQQIGWIHEADAENSTFDTIIEASGSADGFALACKAIRPEGTIVLKSTHKGSSSTNLPALVVNEVRVVGSRCGPFAAALRLLEQKLIHPEPLIDARVPFSQALDAFAQAAKTGALKYVIDFSEYTGQQTQFD